MAIGAPWIFHSIKQLVEPLLFSCHVVPLMLTGILLNSRAMVIKLNRNQFFFWPVRYWIILLSATCVVSLLFIIAWLELLI